MLILVLYLKLKLNIILHKYLYLGTVNCVFENSMKTFFVNPSHDYPFVKCRL